MGDFLLTLPALLLLPGGKAPKLTETWWVHARRASGGFTSLGLARKQKEGVGGQQQGEGGDAGSEGAGRVEGRFAAGRGLVDHAEGRDDWCCFLLRANGSGGDGGLAKENSLSRRQTDLLRITDGKGHRQSHSPSGPFPPAILGRLGVRQLHGWSLSMSYAKGLRAKFCRVGKLKRGVSRECYPAALYRHDTAWLFLAGGAAYRNCSCIENPLSQAVILSLSKDQFSFSLSG